MIGSKSRYKDARGFEASETSSFAGVRPREIGAAPGAVEHVLRENDRLDQLGRLYYNNDRLWWRILDANPRITDGAPLMPLTKSDSAVLKPGDTILIPRAREPRS